MKINKENERRIFLFGLAFVATAYILIQCINNFSLISTAIKDIITMIKPFLLAALISYILYPIVKLFDNKLKVRRFYSVLLTYTLLFAVIALGVNFILPTITSSLFDLLKNLPQYLSQIQSTLANIAINLNLNTDFDLLSSLNQSIIDMLPVLNDLLTKSVTSAVGTTISVFSSVFNGFVTIVASFYILLEQESFINTAKLILKKIFNHKTYSLICNISQALHLNVGKYLIGKSINSVFVAIAAFIGLLIAKSNYAGLLAITFGIMNMIPFIGPIIGTIIAVALNIFTSLPASMFILIYLLVIQQIESFILEPKTIGKTLGLNGFTTLLSITVFGQVFGTIGMVLGVPIMSLIKKYSSDFFNPDTLDNNSNTNEH